MAGDELPEPVEEKTASHEAIDLQAINGSVRMENIKEQMEIKSNALNVNIVNEDRDMVKEEEVPSQLGISQQNQIITEKLESLKKCTLNLEQDVLKNEETSPIEPPNAEEDKVNGETENELHSTQFTEQLSPELVKGDGIPFLSEEIQEKTDSEEVTKTVHQNQISEEDETERDTIRNNLIATSSDRDYQKELEIPTGNGSQNPEDVTTEVDIPSSTTPLVADGVLEEANRKNAVLEEVQKEQIHQIETPKENLPEEKERRDETEDQSRDVLLAASSEEIIAEKPSQENQAPDMTSEEIERKEETTGITKLEETSQIGNDEIIPDEVSTSYDQSITNEETSKRDEGSEHRSEDVKVNDVSESTTFILEAAKGSADVKEDAKEEALQNQIPQITASSLITEVELGQSEMVAPVTENLKVVSNEKFSDDTKSTDVETKSAELEIPKDESMEQNEISIKTSNPREVQIDQTEFTTEQDQPNQELDVKPTKPDQATDELSAVGNSEDDGTLSTSGEQIGEDEESVTTNGKDQNSGIIPQNDDEPELEVQAEETKAETLTNEEITQKLEVDEEPCITQNKEVIPEITGPSEITEIKISQSETVAPETENLEVVSNEKLGTESKYTDIDAETAVLESTTGESAVQEDMSTEPSNTRDQPSEESDVKPTEADQATDEVSAVMHLEENGTLSESVEQIGEVEESIANEESANLQEEDVVVRRSEEEAEKTEASNEKHTEEEIHQITNLSEVTEVESQSEIVAPETENMEVVSDQKFGDASELTDTYPKSAELESTTVESTGGKEISTEPINTREVQIDQTEITTEQDQLIHFSEMKPTEPDQVIDEVCAVENSEVNTTLSASIEQTGEAEGLVATEESVILREEDVVAEMPEQETEKVEATNVEEIPQIAHPSGVTEDQLAESEPVVPEAEHAEIISDQKFGGEIKLSDTDLRSDQMETMVGELIGEKSSANISLSVAQITERPEENEGLLKGTEEQVQEEKTDAIDAVEEPSGKHIDGEISQVADLEAHDAAVQSEIMLNEGKVDSEKLTTEIETPDLEKSTKESALVEDLVHGEGQIEEIEIASKESRVAPQSTIESVTVLEMEVTQGIEVNEEPSDKHIVGEQDNMEASEEIHLVQEDKVDEAQTTASPIEQHDSENAGTEMESAFLENSNGDIDVKADLDATSVKSIVEEEVAVINKTDNGSRSVLTVEETHEEKTKLIDEKIPSDVPDETSNSTENELQEKKDALDTVITEPENQIKNEDLIRAKSQEEISGQEKDIANVIFEAVSEEVDTDTSPKGGDQHTENAAGKEVIGQTERDIDVGKLVKAAKEKVGVDETYEDPQDTVPNFPEQSQEVEEEAKRSEEPERDFASIVSSFLINKVLSEENQKIDDGMKQNHDVSSIPKALDDETIQEIATTKTEPEIGHEEMPYATSSSEEAKPQIQEPEKNNWEKTVKENGEEDEVEQDYLPVSRFLMDKILQQEDNKNLQEEKTIEETDKHLVSDGRIQVEEKIEENSHLVLVPEQKGETASSFVELPRDFEKGETLMRKMENTFVGDGAIFIDEKVEENSPVADLTKLEGDGSCSPIEVKGDFEKEEKPAEAPKPMEEKNKTLVSDVGISNVEENEVENSNSVVVAEQEGKSISPNEAIRDIEKENKNIEQKNEVLVTEGISIVENIKENAGEVAISKQGEKTLYLGEVARDFDKDKPSEEKDETKFTVDEVEVVEEGGNSKVALVEEVEDLAYRERSKDLVEEALVNAQEISYPEKVVEENKTGAMHKEEEHKNEVIVDKESPKDVKNVEENYVFVEHEANQFEEPKEILKEDIVADEASNATIFKLEEKQTNLSAELHNDKTNLVEQVEITEKGMKNSSVSWQDIEESLPDTSKIPMATEVVKELVGNEAEFIHGEEHVKEVADTVVESIENRSQEKLAEIEATKIEKKSEEIKNEEHEEEEEEEEEERHQEGETEIIGRDLTVKAEARETETKSAQKKSHNILSGVGSKVKHSFAKVKKAITGKSKNVSPSAK